MTTRPCPSCGEHTRDGHLCWRCTRHTKRALLRIAELWPTLQETITRQDRTGTTSEIHAQTIHGPLPFAPVASDVAARVRTDLTHWTHICIDTYQAATPPDRIPSMCRFLVAYAADLRRHEHAGTWADQVTWARDSILWAVDLTDRRTPAGPCPESTEDGEPCPGVIVAIYPVDENVSPRMDCTRPHGLPDGAKVCGRSWPSQDFRHLGGRILARQQQIDEQIARGRPRTDSDDTAATVYTPPQPWSGGKLLLSIADAAIIYGVPRSRIEWWIRNGDLERYPRPNWPPDPPGRPGRPVTVAVDPVVVERLALDDNARARRDTE